MGGEIDIFEMTGDPIEKGVWGSYHWGTACGKDREPIPGAPYSGPTGSGHDWQTAYHLYAVEWREDRLDFFVDDILYVGRADVPRTGRGAAAAAAGIFRGDASDRASGTSPETAATSICRRLPCTSS